MDIFLQDANNSFRITIVFKQNLLSTNLKRR